MRESKLCVCWVEERERERDSKVVCLGREKRILYRDRGSKVVCWG